MGGGPRQTPSPHPPSDPPPVLIHPWGQPQLQHGGGGVPPDRDARITRWSPERQYGQRKRRRLVITNRTVRAPHVGMKHRRRCRPWGRRGQSRMRTLQPDPLRLDPPTKPPPPPPRTSEKIGPKFSPGLQPINYWAPLTRKRHIPPHSAQPQHTNHWALRTRKRHQQEHRPQRPTERSDPTQHAKGRPGDCPGPRKETTQPDGTSHGGGPPPRTPPFRPLKGSPDPRSRRPHFGAARHPLTFE